MSPYGMKGTKIDHQSLDFPQGRAQKMGHLQGSGLTDDLGPQTGLKCQVWGVGKQMTENR